MKKLASALLAVLMLSQPFVDVAAAKVLVLEAKDDETIAGGAGYGGDAFGILYLREVVASLFRTYGMRQGVDYDVESVGKYGVNVTNLRAGRTVRGWGGPGASLVQYDAIVMISRGAFNNSGDGFRGDSLRKFLNGTNYNTVPIMMLDFGSAGFSAASDSARYGGDITHNGTLGNVMYSTKHPDVRFRTGTNKVAGVIGSTSGKTRVLIGASVGGAEGTSQDIQSAGFTPFPCMWCDSVWTSSPGVGDSAIAWVRYMDHINGASPLIYVQSNDYAAVSLNIPAIWTGLAFMDSLTSGGVFGDKEPPSFGIMVPGLASRGLATGYPWSTGGIPPDDTTNAYRAAGDSLATLGVPISFGIPANLDSITTYKRDMQYVMGKSGNFRVFPFQRYGIDTSAAAIGAGRTATTKFQPIDPWGAWRQRTAIGDGTFAGKDSSVYTHALRAFGVCDSLYPGRVDHAIYAAVDDWTPINWAGLGRDSLYSAYAKGGARAIVTNYKIERAQNPKRASQLQGMLWQTQRVKAPYANSTLNILATAPVDSGAARFDNGSGAVGTNGGFSTFKQIDRFWQSFIGTRPQPTYGYGGTEEIVWSSDSTWARHKVLVVPFASFGSGVRADRTTLPTRPGWWYTKAIVNAVKTINDFARPGRQLIVIKPVEDVQP